MGGATRGGTAEPTPRDQSTRQEQGQGKRENRKSHKEEEIIGAQTEAARQSRAAPPATKKKSNQARARGRGITVAMHKTSGRLLWMGRTELDGR